MACKTAAATIPHYIVTVLGFRLANVATGTLLAQHRVRNAVPEFLQTAGVCRPRRPVNRMPGHLDHGVPRMHHAFRNRGNPVGMTGAACALGVIEFAGECNQAIVRITFDRCRAVTGMAGDATARCE